MSQEEIFKETASIKFFYSALKIVFGPFFRLIWIKKIEGLENIPKKGPYIIAANHSSYFDFFSLVAVFPHRVYFLAAEKFFKGKIWGLLMRATGQIKVERDSGDKKQVYESVLSALKQGKVIGIFPEGTRSPDGEIHKAFTGVAKFALMAKVPVAPVGISGAYETMSRHKKFPKFGKRIEIKIGEPVDFSEYYNKELKEETLRTTTSKTMKKIAELAGKKYIDG